MPKCRYCSKKLGNDFYQGGLSKYCNTEHYIEQTIQNKNKLIDKGRKIQKAEQKKKDKAKLKELRSRSEWFDILQKLVNQYVKIRDAGKPCCTCGTKKPNIKYDAGHFIPQKGSDPRRFELTNIHIQCSLNCNQHGSGKRAEYREFIRDKYGGSHLEWLECDVNHKSLKKQFPNWQDIEKEILRYRAIIRELGFKPIR